MPFRIYHIGMYPEGSDIGFIKKYSNIDSFSGAFKLENQSTAELSDLMPLRQAALTIMYFYTR